MFAAFAVLAVGALSRPLGAVVFGWIGDRAGRRTSLTATVWLMAGSTFLIGTLPTYSQIGVLAPTLLVVARLLQGLSSGGEWGGSAAYMVEICPCEPQGIHRQLPAGQHRRRFFLRLALRLDRNFHHVGTDDFRLGVAAPVPFRNSPGCCRRLYAAATPRHAGIPGAQTTRRAIDIAFDGVPPNSMDGNYCRLRLQRHPVGRLLHHADLHALFHI